MKLKELSLTEGTIDATILSILGEIEKDGLKSTLHVTTLAKAIVMISSGKINHTINFNSSFNEFSPTEQSIRALNSLSKEEVQNLAQEVVAEISSSIRQVASLSSLTYIKDFMDLVHRSEADD